MINTRARLTKEQEKIAEAFSALKRKWKAETGVSVTAFEVMVYKAALEMKPAEIARRLKDMIG